MSKSINISKLHKFIKADFGSGTLIWADRYPSDFSDMKRTKEHTAAQWNAAFSGKPALNYLDPNGYLSGRILGKPVKAHRVIWAMANGRWPLMIDHINGIRDDNRLMNLREATCRENSKNVGVKQSNKSGTVGVCWDKQTHKWLAYIKDDGKHLNLGRFEKLHDAIHARRSAEVSLDYHPNHGQRQARTLSPN
jgi:hypothetical protein